MQTLTLLGATGSIGEQTLDVVSRHPDRYRLFAVSANTRWQPLAEICLRYRPDVAVMADSRAADALRNHLREAGSDTEVLAGEESLERVAAEADTTVAAIVGAAGVRPTLAAVQAGKRVLLANKEALVVTGQLFMDAVARHEATLLPVDSEHSAIFQCLPGGDDPLAGVKKLCLTASGGPFRTFSAEQLKTVTASQAVRHPNWDMGPKISVDSASLMNKGLELIEASWLFGLPGDRIDVVVHPQSVVHSMVEYLDGSVLAQLGTPDMKTPIAVALAWPERIVSGAEALDFTRMGELSFEAPDVQRFPCLALARQALEAGGTATAVLNAANEEAVAAFLEGRIGFMEIADLVNRALDSVLAPRCRNIDDVMDIDRAARRYVAACLSSRDG